MFTIAAFWCGFHFLVPGILIQTISSRQSQLPCCQRHNGTRKPGVCISGNVSFFLPTHSINCFNILTPLIAFFPPPHSIICFNFLPPLIAFAPPPASRGHSG